MRNILHYFETFLKRFVIDSIARFGIFPSWGLSQKLPRIIGLNRAKELSLSAKPLDAVTAERWGLVNRVVQPGEDVVSAAIEIAESILQNKQDMVLKYKSILNDGFRLSFAEGAALEKVDVYNRFHIFFFSSLTSFLFATACLEDSETLEDFVGCIFGML
jgi:enoyl-CoA hydratase/carnithine racemase